MTDIWRAGVLILFIVAVLPALNSAHADHSLSEFDVTDETIHVDYSQPVPVNVSAERYGETVEITDTQGTPIEEGTDYTWNATTGEVIWNDTSSTSDGEEMRIDYTYYERSGITNIAAAVLGPWGTVLLWLLIVALIFGGYRFAVGSGTGGGL